MGKGMWLIKKQLAEEPITLPKNPFWAVFKRFGIDESIAMIINVVGTFLVSLFASSLILLSLAGPIVEKIGFFPAHFKEAYSVYKTTPKKQRKSIYYYFKKAIKKGSTSLTEDILIHDPIYIVLMFLGLLIYPSTPVWILSALSFVIAVFAVSGLEVGFRELQYLNFKRKMKKAGFELETYIETRFLISASCNQKFLMEKVSKAFSLNPFKSLNYSDIYFENELPEFSGRIPRARLRKRNRTNKKGWMQTIQLIYTKPRESLDKKYEQYRFFPIKKEKLYFMLDQKMPAGIDQINNPKIKAALKSISKKNKEVHFERKVATNKDLLVAVDQIKKKKEFYILELKTYHDKKQLMEAMRFIMREFPVIQTTKSKSDFPKNN